MRKWFIIVLPLFTLITTVYSETKLEKKYSFIFAKVEQGKEILTKSDDFVQRLSPFDRAARMKTNQEVSEEAFLRFVAANVLAWTDNEKAVVESVLSGIRSQIDALSLPLPEIIYLVKTTGKEEGNAAYTRSNAIVFPNDKLAPGKEGALQELICHELFHILTRKNPVLQEKLYASIGFQRCVEIEFPSKLRPVKITNPDAPKNDHYICLQMADSNVWAIPILFSKTPKYDVNRGGEFFDYLQFQFIIVKRRDDVMPPAVIYDDANVQLVSINSVSGFYEQVGSNSEYIIHPEEILADNFAILVQGEERVTSPEVIKRMKSILKEMQDTHQTFK